MVADKKDDHKCVSLQNDLEHHLGRYGGRKGRKKIKIQFHGTSRWSHNLLIKKNIAQIIYIVQYQSLKEYKFKKLI